MKDKEKYDLISIGEAVIDLLPGNGENELLYMPGGAPLNCCVMAAKNGCRTGFCGKLSSDFYGDVLRNVLKENGIRQLCKNDSHERDTTVTLVTLDDHGERKFHFPRFTGADWELTADDIDIEEVTNTRILHFGLRSLLRPPISRTVDIMLQEAGRRDVIISCDVNYRGGSEKAFREGRENLVKRLSYVDIMKISREEALLLGGEDDIQNAMKKYGITLVVETLGEEGARCFFGKKIISHPGFAVEPIDTTGAGDAFWGTFLAKLLNNSKERGNFPEIREDDISEAMVFGNAAASLAVRQKGAIAAMPDRKRIAAFLENII